jgi:hypothetical protein
MAEILAIFQLSVFQLTQSHQSLIQYNKSNMKFGKIFFFGAGLAIIVLPMAIPTHWWHYLLHNQRVTLLKASLYYNKKHKGSTRIVVDVPYHLRHS